MIQRFVAFFLAAVALGACTGSEIDAEAEQEALMELSRQWSNTVATGDIEATLTFWAEDAVMLPPDLPMLEGKDAIRGFVEGAAATPGFTISWEPLTAVVSRDGDMAYMIERNVITVDGPDGEEIVTHGKVVTIWRKSDGGKWENVVDTWNAGPPPAGN